MTTRREVVQGCPAIGTAFAIGGDIVPNETPALPPGAAQGSLPPPQGRVAPCHQTTPWMSQHKARAGVLLADRRDFETKKRGLIAPMKDMKVIADAGQVA